MDTVAEHAWAQWSALGAGGWGNDKELSAPVDPEQLIALTVLAASENPRVMQAARAWLQQYSAFIARPRLKNILSGESAEFKKSAAQLIQAEGSLIHSVRGKSRRAEVALPVLRGRKDLVFLRTRAAFGVGARAELLRLLLQQPERPRTTVWLARYSAYSKRNVADALIMLQHADLVQSRRITNFDEWQLTDPASIRKVIGSFATTEPVPPVHFSFLRMLVQCAEQFEKSESDAVMTEVLARMNGLRHLIATLKLEPLDLSGEDDHRAAYELWARAALDAVAM